jgi:hypothetical protein
MSYPQQIINTIADYLCAPMARLLKPGHPIACEYKQISPQFYLAIVLALSRPSPYEICDRHKEVYLNKQCIRCILDIKDIRQAQSDLHDELLAANELGHVYASGQLFANPERLSPDLSWFTTPTAKGHEFLMYHNERCKALRLRAAEYKLQQDNKEAHIYNFSAPMLICALYIGNHPEAEQVKEVRMTLEQGKSLSFAQLRPSPLLVSMMCRMFGTDELELAPLG